MQRKAQVSIYIVGLVILLGFVFYLSVISGVEREAQVSQTNSILISSSEVSLFVESCLQSAIEEGMLLLGRQGGFVNPQPGQLFESSYVPFYVDLEKNNFPLKSDIEDELSKYIETNIPFCINGFSDFTVQGYDITIGEMEVTSTMQAQSVQASLNYPVSFKRGRDSIQIDRFSASIDFDFNTIYAVVWDLMNKQSTDTEAVHFGHLVDSAYHNNYFFSLNQIGSNTVVYSLRFDTYQINNQPFVFNYAARYSNWLE